MTARRERVMLIKGRDDCDLRPRTDNLLDFVIDCFKKYGREMELSYRTLAEPERLGGIPTYVA